MSPEGLFMSDHDERRRFQRIDFDAPTELRQGDRRWPVKLLDVSLKGMLVERPQQWDADLSQDFDAIIHLDRGVRVQMQVELRHEEPARLGFVCLYIDVESMSHLHRLVELNLADSTEMMRELRELIEEYNLLAD
jgi:PilZ domain